MKACKHLVLGLRLLIAITFLWVVADRIGLLGPIGNIGVVWGNFDNFLDYTALLNPWFPRMLSDALGYIVTIVEIVLAIFLIINYRPKQTAMISTMLFIIFTFSMIFSIGFRAALDFIAFTLILTGFSVIIFWQEIQKENGAKTIR